MQADRRIKVSLRGKLDDAAFVFCLAAFALALAGVAGSALVAGPHSANAVAVAAGQPTIRSAVTGAYVNGAPVYKLPAISVSASRSAEMARIEQEDRQARTSENAGNASRQPEWAMEVLRHADIRLCAADPTGAGATSPARAGMC